MSGALVSDPRGASAKRSGAPTGPSQEAAGGPALTDYALIATEALDWIKANGKAAIKRRAARRART
jgi:hypothetical protein